MVAVLLAGILAGYLPESGTGQDPRWLLAGLAAAVPIVLLYAAVAEFRPRAALLGLVGLLSGAAVLAVDTSGSGIQPLPVAFGLVVAVGLALTLAGRGRPRDVLEGILLTYIGLAFIFEMSIVIHNL